MAFDNDWAALADGLALQGLALADVQAWMSKRDQVLSAFATLKGKEAKALPFVAEDLFINDRLQGWRLCGSFPRKRR